MPPLIYDQTSIDTRLMDLRNVNFDYNYPGDMDFSPGSDKHKSLVKKILQYASESSSSISTKFASWNEIDRTLTAFIELDDHEKEVKFNDPRKPVSIVFPYSYAMLESLQAYMTAAFFQEPIIRYEGVSPEDTIGAILLESIVDLHCNKSKIPLNLHTMFRDSFSYGIGFVAPYWRSERGIVERLSSGLFGGIFRESKEELLFEGNALGNIDPYLALPDPNVPMHDLQKGEFFGWVERSSYSKLLEKEKDGGYFNCRYLNSLKNRTTSIYGLDNSAREDKALLKQTGRYHPLNSRGSKLKGMTELTKPIDLIHMFCNIIPQEWELGKSEYPEKWLFSLAADSVIVRAKPLGLNHGKFPVAVAAPDFDGYSAFPTSRLEMLYGLQGVLDWMFNAHIANVRKTINDVLIYDPYLINSKDINSSEAGKRIRIRRPGWGKGVKDVVMQLPVTDITKGHIADSSFVVNWMQKVGAVDDIAMGSLRQGGPERLTSAEFQGTQMGQLSRLGRIARIVGLQAMQDIGEMFGSHTQQLMSQETYIKATGEWQNVLIKEYGLKNLAKNRGKVRVNPNDLLINYDVKVRDGSIPGGNNQEVFLKMFDRISQHPELLQVFDIGRIFMHIARNTGAKNVQDFVRVSVAPDEQVLDLEDKGNIIPLNQAGV